ncbi:MAG: 4-hydroxy-tetrahydrodipicolinate reductase [Pseudomonadota bacterium]
MAGAGRMGQAVAALIAADASLELAGVWTRDTAAAAPRFPAGSAVSGDLGELLADGDCVVDFSLPEGSVTVAREAADLRVPLVCGVSGLSASQLSALERAAERVPVVFDRNMSQGIAVLTQLVERAAKVLGPAYRICIDETHHVNKLDAPSGTALKLGEAAATGLGRCFDDLMWYEPGREDAEAPGGAIRFSVQRQGDVPGEHEISFASASERLTLAHSVASRSVFAEGALRAAAWVTAQPPGLYAMRHVLGFEPA